jgi:hypothetical protein
MQVTPAYCLKPATLIHVPSAPVNSRCVEIPVPARTAWKVVGDFGGFTRFITGLSRIEMTGEGVRSVRKKYFADGNVVIEQLNSHNDDDMVMTWSLIYTTFNIGNLWAAMHVDPINEGACRVTWDIIGEPWEGNCYSRPAFDEFINGFLEMAMTNLVALFGSCAQCEESDAQGLVDLDYLGRLQSMYHSPAED